MSKNLSRIATWKKENRQKYKDPFCRGMMWKNLGLPVSPENPEMYKNPFCRGNSCSTFPDSCKINIICIRIFMLMNVDKPQNLCRMRNLQFQPSTACIKRLPSPKSGTCHWAYPCRHLGCPKKLCWRTSTEWETCHKSSKRFSLQNQAPNPFFWCTFMIFRNTKNSTEWGTYSFSQLQNCPSKIRNL